MKAGAGQWEVVKGIGDLAGDGPFAGEVAGRDVVIVRSPAGLRAYDGLCPHRGALLAEGELEGGELVCRNHRWRFDAESGRRIGGPECLRACPLRQDGGALLVDASALGGATRAVGGRRIRDLPRPRGLPLLGNLHQLRLDRLHLTLEAWARELGPVYRLRLGPRKVVVVADAGLADVILRARPDTWRRLSNIEPIFRELGVAGVFSAEGAAWRPQRRLAMEALSHRNLKTFYPVLHAVTDRLRRRWLKSAAAGVPVDISMDMRRFTIDITTQLAFDHDVNVIEREDDEIQRRLELVFPAFSRRMNATVPLWRFIRLPADRRLDRALAELRAWLAEVIATTRARIAAAPPAGRPANFLEAMLTARDQNGQPFSDEVVFGNAMTMLLAGEDTTANTMSWAVDLLGRDRAAVAALRAEIDQVLGSAPIPDDIEQANRLEYALAVANEAMRLRPVAPVFFLEPVVDTTLGDLEMPRGTTVMLLIRPQAMDPASFGAPDAFRPERWLGRPDGAHDPAAHIPFGSGPRICPGRSLALLEMRVVLAMLYQNFEVAPAAGAGPAREVWSFTMAPDAVPVVLTPRVRVSADPPRSSPPVSGADLRP